jgi:hypothetical protein
MKTEIRICVIKCNNIIFNIQGNKRKYTNLNFERISKTCLKQESSNVRIKEDILILLKISSAFLFEELNLELL